MYLVITAVSLGLLMQDVLLAQAAQQQLPAAGITQTMPSVLPYEFRGDLRELPQVFSLSGGSAVQPHLPLLNPPKAAKFTAGSSEAQPALLSTNDLLIPMPGPLPNFAGMSRTDDCDGVPGPPVVNCGSGWPPDVNGDVGPNHYIQAVNTAFAIYNKTGTLLASFKENALWTLTGANPCNGNSAGDPVVLYDQLADRWILTHLAFASPGGVPTAPFFECIATSETSDPVAGGWWLYPLRFDPGTAGTPPVGALNDYPKFGNWTDCLYMSANEFTFSPGEAFAGTSFASFNKDDLYSGATLRWSLEFLSGPSAFTMIPSNLQGRLPGQMPAPGTPNYFVSESTSGFAFDVRKFTAGPNCGGGGVLSAPTSVSHATTTVFPGTVVTQPPPATGANLLDSVGDRLMQKVQYRKVGSTESLWVVHTVQNTGETVRPQWAQIDVTGGTVATTPVQQQIYAPDTTLHRWMASIAADNQGNVALGYSTSNDTAPNFPSIAYSGRLAGDPLNTLPQTETQLIAGSGSQVNTCGGAPCDRWGDYTSMSVDPVDDCSFWYTNEYYSSQANGNVGNWQTRIGSFKFPSCTAPGGTLSLSRTSVDFGNRVTGTASPIETITLSNLGPGDVTITALGATGNAATANDFALDAPQAGDCPISVPFVLTAGAPGNSCNLRTSFNPQALGLRQVHSVFTAANATNSGISFDLSGTGVQLTFSAVNSSQSVGAGGAASYNLNFSILGGALTNALTFSASGLPAATSAAFSPASVAAGNTTASTTLSITTTARSSAVPAAPHGTGPPPSFFLYLLVCLACGLLSLLGRAWQLQHRKLRGAYLTCALLVMLAALAGCGGGGSGGSGGGGGGGPTGTPAGSYPITVTATSGSLVRTTTVTLVVQ